MKKAITISFFLSFICCKKTEIKTFDDSKNDSVPSAINTINRDSIIASTPITEAPIKGTTIINTFTYLPQRFSNESDAQALLYTDSDQIEKNGKKYVYCDFINNVAIVKINNKFEKLNDISGTDSYFENKVFENAYYRLELDLNEKISKSLSNKIINNIPLEGAFVLKGTITVIDLTNNNEIAKNTFVLGFN